MKAITVDYTDHGTYNVESETVKSSSIPDYKKLVDEVLSGSCFNPYSARPHKLPTYALVFTDSAREKLGDRERGFLELLIELHNDVVSMR